MPPGVGSRAMGAWGIQVGSSPTPAPRSMSSSLRPRLVVLRSIRLGRAFVHQVNNGLSYGRGDDVLKEFVLAHMWLNIAESGAAWRGAVSGRAACWRAMPARRAYGPLVLPSGWMDARWPSPSALRAGPPFGSPAGVPAHLADGPDLLVRSGRRTGTLSGAFRHRADRPLSVGPDSPACPGPLGEAQVEGLASAPPLDARQVEGPGW